MKLQKCAATVLSVALLCGFSHVAGADSTDATCEFYSHGDLKKDRSGPCTFSQRQGYVDIGLKNGKAYNLSPGKESGHYKDQEDHKVVLEKANGDKQVYKWDQKKIVVSFNKGGSSAAATSGGNGHVAVKDMGRYCAGEASAKFKQRPANISTQDAIQDQGLYSVFGQFPPSGADPTVFICTFTADGKFVGVDKQ